eukprot:CAMPEP_0204842718 /NCGR_PEP_ID=MMETSP1346-20131115/47550_1 /ASSEMBLY_ACC=CAM_ASM_000771 /TAXON_ID=215587 /ORGANISM="Aplanochytrium stocchinoi, Strain GSBS06" /LENGTH=904 /DNA_ID=CAMNT_0051981735 /DNA_START=64 /DNA_END=2778 /DNA_ORIENTATION=+
MATIRFKEKTECRKLAGRKHFERLSPAAPFGPESNSDTELKWGETDYEKAMSGLRKRLDPKLLDDLFNDPKKCAKLVPPEFFEFLLGKALLSGRIDLAKSIVRFCKKQARYQQVKVSNEFFDDLARRQNRHFPFAHLIFLSLVRKGNVELVRFALENSHDKFSIDDVCVRDGDMKTTQWLDKELDEMTAEEKFRDATYKSAKINKAEYEVETMLTAALKSGSKEMVHHILHKGADPFAHNYQAFKVASRLGLIKDMKYMLNTKKTWYLEKKQKMSSKQVRNVYSICFANAAMEDQKDMMNWLAKSIRDNPALPAQKVFQKSVNTLVIEGSAEFCCYRFRIMNGINELLRIKDLMVGSGNNKASNRNSLSSVGSLESVNSYVPADFVKLYLLYDWFRFVTRGHEFRAPQVVDDLFFLGLDKFFCPKVHKKDKSKNKEGEDSTEGGSNGSPDNFSMSDTSSLNDSWDDNISDSGRSHLSRASRQVAATMTNLRRGSLSLANTIRQNSVRAAGGKGQYASRQQKIEALGLAAVFGNERVLNKMIDLVLPKDDKLAAYLKAATKRNKSTTCKILLDRLSARIDQLVKQNKGRRNTNMGRRKTMKEMDINGLSKTASSFNFMAKNPKEFIREAIINEMENKTNHTSDPVPKKSMKGKRNNTLKVKGKPNTRRQSTAKRTLKRARSIVLQKKASVSDSKYPKDIDKLYGMYLTYLLKYAIAYEYKALEVAELLVADKYCSVTEAEKIIKRVLLSAVTRQMKRMSGIEIVSLVKLLFINAKKGIASGKEKTVLNDYLAEFGRELCQRVINSPVDDLNQLSSILKEVSRYTGGKILRVNDLKLFFEVASNNEKKWTVLWGEYVYLLFENMDPQEQAKVSSVSYASVADIDGNAKKAWDTVLDAAEKGITTVS